MGACLVRFEALPDSLDLCERWDSSAFFSRDLTLLTASCNWVRIWRWEDYCVCVSSLRSWGSYREFPVFANWSWRELWRTLVTRITTFAPSGVKCVFSPFEGLYRHSVTCESVGLEKYPVEIQDCRRIPDQFRGISHNMPQFNKCKLQTELAECRCNQISDIM